MLQSVGHSSLAPTSTTAANIAESSAVHSSVAATPEIHHLLVVHSDSANYATVEQRQAMENRVTYAQHGALNKLLEIQPTHVYVEAYTSGGPALRGGLRTYVRSVFAGYEKGQKLDANQRELLSMAPAEEIYGALHGAAIEATLTPKQMTKWAAAGKRVFSADGTPQAGDHQVLFEDHDRWVAQRILGDLQGKYRNTAVKLALITGYNHDIVPFVDARIATVREYDIATPYFAPADRAQIVQERAEKRLKIMASELAKASLSPSVQATTASAKAQGKRKSQRRRS